MIKVRGLTRSFKTKTGTVDAVKAIDFDVADGEIVGLLGPNGAGKTTTLKMLTTLLDPTAGEANVAGIDLRDDSREVRRRIGYVAQIGATPSPGIRLGEELIVQARLHGMSKQAASDRLTELLPSLDLAGFEGRSLKEMSGGQRRRFDIAVGLIHSPKLIFLDEPTTGLDPQSRANLWEHIRKLRSEHGATIVLTTHYLDEADALADRLLVMDEGRIVADETAETLKARVSGDVITVTVNGDMDRATEVVTSAVDLRTSSVEGNELFLTVEQGKTAVPAVIRSLDQAGIELESVAVRRPSLDDAFLALTGRSLREEA